MCGSCNWTVTHGFFTDSRTHPSCPKRTSTVRTTSEAGTALLQDRSELSLVLLLPDLYYCGWDVHAVLCTVRPGQVRGSRCNIGTFLAVVSISGVISNALWGYLGEKYSVRYILSCTSALACTAPLAAILVQYLSPAWQVPCYFLVFVFNGAAMSGSSIGFMAYLLNIAPSLNRPSYVGFMNTVLFPFSFMPMLAGQLIEFVGYAGMFAVSIGMGLLGFITTTQLEEIHQED